MGTQTEPIIRVNNVTFRYPGAAEDVLRNVSLTIERGDFIAVAGSNGSGKSTLCKCFNGLIPKYYVGDMEGEIEVGGQSADGQTVSALSRQVAYVFQDFENQLVRPTVYEEAYFAPLNYGFPDYMERGLQALELLDLSHLRNEWIWQLSGGQKHLVALAGALSLDPDVIIVDEPVAQLDPYHAGLIYDKLKMLNEQYGKTIIVIEHHTEFIADYCSRLIMMDQGRIRWIKPVEEGLSAVEELAKMNIQPPQVTQVIHRLDPKIHQNKETMVGYPITVEHAAEHLSTARVSAAKDVSAWNVAKPVSKDRSVTVAFNNVTYGYKDLSRKMNAVLKGIDLTLHAGDRIALVGNNGAGKSTLMRLISGIRKPWLGEVTVCGINTRDVSPEQLSDRVSFIFQNPEEMFIEDNIRRDVEHFLHARKIEGYPEFVSGILERFRLNALQERDGRLLSGGQQRRATLAIGLAMRPTVMLLDEPTASLDLSSRKEMTLLLEELKDSVQTVVVATHDMQLVADWATRVIVMHDGVAAMDADARTVFDNAALLRQAGLVPPQIVQLSHRLKMMPVCLSVEEFVARLSVTKPEENSFGIV